MPTDDTPPFPVAWNVKCSQLNLEHKAREKEGHIGTDKSVLI